MAYHYELIIGRRFSKAFSLQISPAYTYRNLVADNDVNGMFTLGLASRLQVSKLVAFLVDARFPFDSVHSTANGYYLPIGFGIEFDTGGSSRDIREAMWLGLRPGFCSIFVEPVFSN